MFSSLLNSAGRFEYPRRGKISKMQLSGKGLIELERRGGGRNWQNCRNRRCRWSGKWLVLGNGKKHFCGYLIRSEEGLGYFLRPSGLILIEEFDIVSKYTKFVNILRLCWPLWKNSQIMFQVQFLSLYPMLTTVLASDVYLLRKTHFNGAVQRSFVKIASAISHTCGWLEKKLTRFWK